MDSTRTLTITVIAMSAALLAGVFALVILLLAGVDRQSSAPFNTALAMAPGESLEQATITEGRLLLRLAASDGRIRLLLFDADDGRQLGAWVITAGAAQP